MGNHAAVNPIAAKTQRRTGKPLRQIILAAAAVDADAFQQRAQPMPKLPAARRRRAGCTISRVPV
jgi:esterase/lipase superfamily enzyme